MHVESPSSLFVECASVFGMTLQFVAFVCFRGAVSELVVAPPATLRFSGAESMLARSCGHQCLALLHAQSTLLGPNHGSDVPETNALLGALAEVADRKLEHAVGLVVAGGAGKSSAASRSVSTSGIACSTPAACAAKTLGANKCNYARVALQQAYNELNVATHALGVLVSSLCGCVRSGHMSTCALRNVPAACAFPYTVYAKAFAGSTQVWQAVKASTATCILHGDPGLLQ